MSQKKVRLMISYEWTTVLSRGTTVKQVVDRCAEYLTVRYDFEVWYDRKCLNSGDIVDEMAKAIDRADVVVFMLTQLYHDKVRNGGVNDNCKREFNFAANRKLGMIIPVVLEPTLKDQKKWSGPIGFSCGNFLFQDLSDLSRLEASMDGLSAIINDLVHKSPEERPVALQTIPQQESMNRIFVLQGSFQPFAVIQSKAMDYVDGTRVDVKQSVEKWYSKGPSRSWKRVMAFLGPAGYGKSVVMAYLCFEGGLLTRRKTEGSKRASNRFRISLRRLSLGKTTKFTVGAAHFFKHDESNAASVHVCFLSIANQLAALVPGLKEELEKLDTSAVEGIRELKVLFRTVICAPLMNVKDPGRAVVVILDALDEVNPDQKEELLEIIRTMWERDTPTWLGLLVSSRPEDSVKNELEQYKPHVFEIHSKGNLNDLNVFLRQRLARYMKSEQELGQAVAIMAERSDGLFLYASFVEDMLKDREDHSLTLKDIKDSEEFPPGLDGMYKKYFTRFLQGPLECNYDHYNALLSSMVAARTPLDINTVGALLELDDEDDIDEFLRRAEQLLEVQGDTIRFVHKSMPDYLQDKKRSGKVAAKETRIGGKRLGVSVKMGHEKLAQVLHSDPLSVYALNHLIYHLCKAKNWDAVREHLLDFDWVHAAVSSPGTVQRLIQDSDALYNYEDFSDIKATDVIRAIELGRSDILSNPHALAFHLLGRIQDRSHPILMSLSVSEFTTSDVAKEAFVPIRATLQSARSPMRKMMEGHSDQVNSVAIDGDFVVSGSWDTTVRLWDRRSGRCLQVLEGHSDVVQAVAMVGDTVVSGSLDKTVRLWDRRSGECLYVLEGHSDQVNAVTIDGDTVASGSSDKTLRLWDRQSGRCLYVLQGHTGLVNAVAMDGDTVLSGSSDKTVRLWDRRSGEGLQVLEGHYDSVLAVAIDGDTVVSGSSDETVRLWDRQSGECLQVLEGHSFDVDAVAIDGDTVVSGSSDTTVRLWDRRSGECLQVLEGRSNIRAVAIDGDTVVSGSWDKTVRLWDRRSASAEYLQGQFHVRAVAIDRDTVVSGSDDNTVRLWDRRSGECLQVLEGHASDVDAVAIDGDTVVSGSWDNTVRLWDRRSGECLQVLEGHSDFVFAVSIRGDTVVSGSWDCTVRLWDRRSGECVHVLEGHSDYVFAVAMDGDTVVSGSQDKTVRVWDRRSGECLQVLQGHSKCVNAVAIDGDTVVSGSDDNSVRLWDRRSGECLQALEGHSFSVNAVAVFGETLMSGSLDKTVRLWDRKSGKCVQVLAFDAEVSSVAVESVERNVWIVVSDGKIPHILTPLSTQHLNAH